MFEEIARFFSFGFIQRALAVGLPVALCSALLGTSLVLKRYSMIGDGLSHVGFGALAIAAALNVAPLAVAIPTVMAAAFLLLRISRSARINGDAAIAVISSASLAAGVIVLAFGGGGNTDVNSYLFGSILALNRSDVVLSLILCAAVLAAFVLLYHRLFASTFDAGYAAATGGGSGGSELLSALMTAVVIVLGMRLMGALLISALLIFPPLTAMRVCKSYRGTTVCAALVSMGCFAAGIVGSYVYDLPAGAGIVAISTVVLALFWLIGLLPRLRQKT